MMRTRKILLLLLTALLVLSGVFLAGCGGAGEEGNGEETGIEETGIEEKSLIDVPEVVNTTKERAGNAARSANLQAIDAAIQSFYFSEGAYPTTVNQLVPQYLRSVPVDPLGGAYYIASEGGVARAAVR